MVFSDLFFLFVFIPAFAVCYLLASLAKGNKLKNLVLILFSLIFYAWGEPVYVFLMLACSLLNYLFGLGIDGSNARRKLFLVLGVTTDLIILGTFKYLGFLVSQLNVLGIQLPDPNISLPIGISFYIFQSISYLVDVYREESPAQKNFFSLLLYISMFPQLIAGPIVRYSTVSEEINNRKVSIDDISEGIFRFIIGLGKKVILANQLSEVAGMFLANNHEHLTVAGAWVGIIAFALQIYFDFSGYSDMAIGIGRCLGFHFKENFDHPYTCDTITDFWRRWHISLGSFFRDYVYIPMGGNRRHQALNIMVVWCLTGLWHGASWNFVIWGLYFGVIVMVEKFTILKIKDKIPSFILHIYAMFLVLVGWGIFYFDDFSQMTSFFSVAFGKAEALSDVLVSSTLLQYFWLIIAALLFCLPVGKWLSKFFNGEGTARNAVALTLKVAASLAILVLSVALLVGATNNAFLYTRF